MYSCPNIPDSDFPICHIHIPTPIMETTRTQDRDDFDLSDTVYKAAYYPKHIANDWRAPNDFRRLQRDRVTKAASDAKDEKDPAVMKRMGELMMLLYEYNYRRGCFAMSLPFAKWAVHASVLEEANFAKKVIRDTIINNAGLGVPKFYAHPPDMLFSTFCIEKARTRYKYSREDAARYLVGMPLVSPEKCPMGWAKPKEEGNDSSAQWRRRPSVKSFWLQTGYRPAFSNCVLTFYITNLP